MAAIVAMEAMDMVVMEVDTAVDMETVAVMEVMAAMVIMVKLTNIHLDKSSMFFSWLIQE